MRNRVRNFLCLPKKLCWKNWQASFPYILSSFFSLLDKTSSLIRENGRDRIERCYFNPRVKKRGKKDREENRWLIENRLFFLREVKSLYRFTDKCWASTSGCFKLIHAIEWKLKEVVNKRCYFTIFIGYICRRAFEPWRHFSVWQS